MIRGAMKEGDVIPYLGKSNRGSDHGSLGILDEPPGPSHEGWVSIRTVRKDGTLEGMGACSVADLEPAEDDGRIAAYHRKQAENEARHLQWAERYSTLLRLIEERHGLQEGQARVIYGEVDAAHAYLQEPPEGPWQPEEKSSGTVELPDLVLLQGKC